MASSLTSCIFACLFLFQFSLQYVQGQSSQVTITNNGYKGIVVAIAPHIDHTVGEPLIEKIKQIFTSGSEALYRATRLRAFFEEVTILVPQSWPRKAEYVIAGSENFGMADVRIDDPDPEHGDGPYTLQPLGCGSPGLFTHLTPGYLQKLPTNSTYEWGHPGKVLVHEWAHLRYGIFDEYGYMDNPVFPLFYYEGEQLVPNACTNQAVEGVFWDVLHNKACTFDSEGNPNEGCIYTPNLDKNDKITSSLDSYHFLKNVETFCDDTRDHYHNKRAPNKQNLLCEGRSTWSIIEQHKDFVGGSNQPRNVGNVIPKFTVVQQMEATYSLVLDISGSMSTVSGGSMPRRQILYETVKRWLQEEVQLGVAVGIIMFDTFASVVHPIQKIDTEQKRNEIISKIPNKAEAATCIGCGLQMAVKELQKYRKAPGGIIVLVTDGEETNHPFIQEVIPELVKAKTRVVAIALHTQNSANLETAAKATGGKIFSIPPGAGIDKLGMAFFEALTFQASEFDLAQKVHSAKVVGTSQSYTGHFSIDATIGNDTTVDFSTAISNDIADVTITANGFTAPISSAIREEKLVRFKFPSLKAGKYTYVIKRKNGNNPAEIHVSVTSKARSKNSKPIATKCWVQEEPTITQFHCTNTLSIDLHFDQVLWYQFINKPDLTAEKFVTQLKSTAAQPRFVILAEVKQGNNPVVNAAVIVKVDRPTKKPVIFQLFDNGNGAPDVTRNDGIYSGYFTRFAGKGRYSVSAQVTDDGKAAIREVGYTGSRVMRVPHGYPGNKTVTETSTGEFERENEGGAITITNEIDEDKVDLFPPSRVTDLRVAGVSDDGTRVILQWTAPGDDLDTGNASSYDIRYSYNWTELATNFSRVHRLNSTSRPRPAGEQERYVTTIPNVKRNVSIFVALQASDDAGHTSKTSNIVEIPKRQETTATTAPPPTTAGDSNLKITILNIHKVVVEGKWIPQWVRDLIKANAKDVYVAK